MSYMVVPIWSRLQTFIHKTWPWNRESRHTLPILSSLKTDPSSFFFRRNLCYVTRFLLLLCFLFIVAAALTCLELGQRGPYSINANLVTCWTRPYRVQRTEGQSRPSWPPHIAQKAAAKGHWLPPRGTNRWIKGQNRPGPNSRGAFCYAKGPLNCHCWGAPQTTEGSLHCWGACSYVILSIPINLKYTFDLWS